MRLRAPQHGSLFTATCLQTMHGSPTQHCSAATLLIFHALRHRSQSTLAHSLATVDDDLANRRGAWYHVKTSFVCWCNSRRRQARALWTGWTIAGTSTTSVCSPKPGSHELLPAVSGTADNLPEPYQPPPSTAATSDDGIPTATNGTLLPPSAWLASPANTRNVQLRGHWQT